MFNRKHGRRRAGLITALAAVVGLFVFATLRENPSPYIESIAEVSLFVAVTIATHFIYHFFEEEEHIDQVKEAIDETAARILEGSIAAASRYGLAGFQERLDYGRLLDSLRPNDELLWQDTFAQSYAIFMSRLKPALERGCKIRMLVIDPQCDNALYRAQEIGDNLFDDPAMFSNQVANFISTISSIAGKAKSAPGSIEVRTYNDLPGVPLYIVRSSGNLTHGYSSYFFHRATDGFFHIHWRFTPDGFLREAAEYFERKWKAHEKDVVFPIIP